MPIENKKQIPYLKIQFDFSLEQDLNCSSKITATKSLRN